MKLDIDNPKAFYNIIPKNEKENLDFRIKLHSLLAKEPELQKIYLELCRRYVPIMFATTFMTLNPFDRINHLFIPRPKQIKVITELDKAIHEQRDFGIEKSREEGATEIVCKTFAAWCILYELCNFVVGSRNADLVDDLGKNYTLFAKLDNVIENLPSWFGLSQVKKTIERKERMLKFVPTNSVIEGDTTNENFSAGGRGTGVFFDEFGRVRKAIADSIEGSIHDVAKCVIYGSTHWLGPNHTFNQCLQKETTHVETLMWWENPEKNKGFYTSPEAGKIKLLDKDYYIEKDKFFEDKEDFNLESIPEEYRNWFVADGCVNLPKPLRSPWHDYEEKHRDKRDFMCNVWGNAYGASDLVFDETVLLRIKERDIKYPDYKGELTFDMDEDGVIDYAEFDPYSGKKHLKWWGELTESFRPNQAHNYIIGCDISQGVGSSNSVAAIYDVNTEELVGIWADANTEVKLFADTVVALAEWIGGVDKPYLIWEVNGGYGQSFNNRILWHEYHHIYMQHREDSTTRKKSDRPGWHSRGDDKEILLSELNIALCEGLKKERKYISIRIHSEELYKELCDYVFSEGSEIITSATADMSSGARKRHGDRVIATGLCILGTKDQTKGDYKNSRKVPVNSFKHRYDAFYEKRRANERYAKKYLF